MANLLVLSYGEVNRPWYPRHIEGLLLADSYPSSPAAIGQHLLYLTPRFAPALLIQRLTRGAR